MRANRVGRDVTMPVYRVLAFRTESFVIESFIRANDRGDAEERFHGVLEEPDLVLCWTENFDGSITDIDSIEEIRPDHEPVPSSDRSLCLLCGHPVRWTGTAAQSSPTGQTIPGPWIHSKPSNAGEGLGL
jgi:hypothetical protein